MPELTERETDVLMYICDYAAETGYPPTQKEIATGLGLSVTRIVQLIDALKRKRYIDQTPKQARAISVIGGSAH